MKDTLSQDRQARVERKGRERVAQEAPFLLCALPRSRTAWLAAWLSAGRVRCAHELLTRLHPPHQGPKDRRMMAAMLAARLAAPAGEVRGNADTLQALLLPELLEELPEARIIVVRREPREVCESLHRLGLPLSLSNLAPLLRALDAAAALPGALELDFRALDYRESCRALLAHAAPGEPFDEERWSLFRGVRITSTAERLQELARGAAPCGGELLQSGEISIS